jgi:hypothetical protein
LEGVEFCKLSEDEIREVIASHGNRVNGLLDKDGWPLLCAAAKHGRHEFVLELIKDFGADVCGLTPDLCIPLHFATSYETADILIQHGGNAIVTKMNDQAMNPLMQQCNELRVGPVRRLLEHPKVKQEINARICDRNDAPKAKLIAATALYFLCATFKDDEEVDGQSARKTIMELLLNAGADPLTIQESGFTPMYMLRWKPPTDSIGACIHLLQHAVDKRLR